MDDRSNPLNNFNLPGPSAPDNRGQHVNYRSAHVSTTGGQNNTWGPPKNTACFPHPNTCGMHNHNNNHQYINAPNFADVLKAVPSFGDNNTHPVKFIEELECAVTTHNIPFNRLPTLGQHLFLNDARTWSDAMFDIYPDFHSFKRGFLDQFWGDIIQMQARGRIETGSFVSGSITNYFLSIIKNAKYLVPAYSDPILITLVARHFPVHISTTLIGTNTIAEALNRLRQAEFITAPSYTPPVNNINNFNRNVNNFNPNRNIMQRNNINNFNRNRNNPPAIQQRQLGPANHTPVAHLAVEFPEEDTFLAENFHSTNV
jgi:hypothetical protein